MHLILDTRGLTLKKRNGAFHVSCPDQTDRIIAVGKIHSIAITSHCTLNTSALRLAIQHQIPIYILDAFGRVEGRLGGASYGEQAALRRAQVLIAETPAATDWVVELFRLKNAGQIANLKWLQNRNPSHTDSIETAIAKMQEYEKALEPYRTQLLIDCRNTLMGFEGNAARHYWQQISQCLPADWQFGNRNRQPAQDPFNAALNYLYGMLYTTIETAIFAAGLDPNLGFLHADTHGKPTLSFDLIEPFRPKLDRLLIEAIKTNMTLIGGFDTNAAPAVSLNKKGKAIIIPLYNNWLIDRGLFDHKITTHRHQIYRFAGALAQFLKKNDKTNPF